MGWESLEQRFPVLTIVLFYCKSIPMDDAIERDYGLHESGCANHWHHHRSSSSRQFLRDDVFLCCRIIIIIIIVKWLNENHEERGDNWHGVFRIDVSHAERTAGLPTLSHCSRHCSPSDHRLETAAACDDSHWTVSWRLLLLIIVGVTHYISTVISLQLGSPEQYDTRDISTHVHSNVIVSA